MVYGVDPTPGQQRILAAAERLYKGGGLDALSIRRVAELVGVTPMAIYRHYRDKDALLEALVGLGFERWEKYLARAARRRTPLRRFEAALTQYREFALDEPRLFELMFLIPRPNVPHAPASLRMTSSPAFGVMIASVREAMEAGALRRGDPGETILALWAAAHGLTALHFSGRFGGDDAVFRRVYDRTMKQLLQLFTPEPPK
ncbi:MAG TPA: TetR/AcrR family transcriptional regulator [Longimicrobium sp.]|jgi:AcrR family transcriptional regulator